MLTAGEWTGDAVFLDGEDVTDQVNEDFGFDITQDRYTFERNGDYTESIAGNNLEGKWEYQNNERVIVFDEGTDDEFTVVISKLDEDEFFYDVLHRPDGAAFPLKVRSMVGIIPLFAVTTIEPALLEQLPEFAERLDWFLDHRADLAALVSHWQVPGLGQRRLLALCRGHRMKRVLRRALDPAEFLSLYGIRSLSRYHIDHPYSLEVQGVNYSVTYQPGESQSGLFGGNSNWRGPVWFPVNYLLIEALQQFHHYYGDDFLVECPTNSGHYMTLKAIADELSNLRIVS